MKIKITSSQKLLLVLVLIVGLALVFSPLGEYLVAFSAWVSDRQAVSETLAPLGIWGPVLLLGLLVLQVFLAIIPGHALMLAGGYIYGFTASFIITTFSTILGSQIAFLVARRFGREVIYRLASPQVIERWDGLAAGQGGLFYFFTFVLPVFPSDLMCYVAGLGKVSPWRFFVANILGRMICAAFISLVGAYGLQLPVIFWVIVVAGMGGAYTAWLIFSRRSSAALKGSEASGIFREARLCQSH